MFTSFEQMDFPVDSTRSRCNKVRLFISFAIHIDISAGRANVTKHVNPLDASVALIYKPVN